MTDGDRSHWREVTLGEVADVNWGDTSTTKSSYTEVGYPAFSASGNDGNLPYADFDRTGVVVSAIGANCGVTWLAKGKWSCIKNTLRFWATDPTVDTEYLYWRTRNPDVWPKRGSAQPFISQGDARAIKLLLPPLDDQRAIAGVLGALDDKIEQNRRTARALERLVRAIFRAWFVDFEPVKAKAEGSTAFPGMPQAVFDALPTRFVDSPIGPVPEGWEVAHLAELAEIRGGKQLPSEDCNAVGPFPVYGANGRMGYTDRPTHEGFVIAFGRVGAYCGSLHWTYGGAWINNNASSVVPRSWPEFVLQALLETDFERMRRGSAQPFIPNGSLSALEIVVPTNGVLTSFSDVARSLRLEENALIKESRKLAEMRDYLLPKLLSGQVRVEVANG